MVFLLWHTICKLEKKSEKKDQFWIKKFEFEAVSFNRFVFLNVIKGRFGSYK
jgi:hypothetical protein